MYMEKFPTAGNLDLNYSDIDSLHPRIQEFKLLNEC